VARARARFTCAATSKITGVATAVGVALVEIGAAVRERVRLHDESFESGESVHGHLAASKEGADVSEVAPQELERARMVHVDGLAQINHVHRAAAAAAASALAAAVFL